MCALFKTKNSKKMVLPSNIWSDADLFVNLFLREMMVGEFHELRSDQNSFILNGYSSLI